MVLRENYVFPRLPHSNPSICLWGGVAKYNLIPPYTGLKKVSFGPLNGLSLLQQVIIRIIVV
jgi:hypothetical protein